MNTLFKLVLSISLFSFIFSCGQKNQDEAQFDPANQLYVALAETALLPDSMLSTGTARGVGCSTLSFGSCSSNQKTLNYAGCSAGTSTVSGMLTLSWVAPATCGFALSNNQSISLTMDITASSGTMSARTYTTSNNSVSIQKQLTTLQLQNQGLRRILTQNGDTLSDITTTFTQLMSLSSIQRNGRVASGGTVSVIDTTNAQTCSMTAQNITWAGNCNCPVSGSFQGTCTKGIVNRNLTVTYGANCGSITVSDDGTLSTLTLDRCIAE